MTNATYPSFRQGLRLGLTQRQADLERRINSKRVLLEDAEATVAYVEDAIKLLEGEAQLLTKVDAVLLMISSRVLGQSTQTIDQLVTAGLRLVFDDQKLEFRSSIDKLRGKTAIKFELLQDGRSAPIMSSYGGGPIAIIGVLLRVCAILALDLRRILLLDETFAHLSEKYIPNASALLHKICEDLGFTVLLVTHQPAFAEAADLHYEAHRGKVGTEFRLLTGK